MKRSLSLVLTLLMLCVLVYPAFAAEITDGSDVVVIYDITYEGEYRGEVADGAATAGGITVTDIPENAVTLVIVPMKGEALSWIKACVDDDVTAAYDIHFLDADGNRINADGAEVSAAVSGSELTVRSVATSGTDSKLTGTVSGGMLSFTTDGSHYYVICGKPGGDTVTVPVRGNENTVHADVTIVGGNTVKLHELDIEEIEYVVGDHVETGVVEIDLTGLDADVNKVILPVTTVEFIVEAAEEVHNDTEALQIDFPYGSVRLDDKSMRSIVEQAEGSEVMLVLENAGESRLNDAQKAALADKNVVAGFEVCMVCGDTDKLISDFRGGEAALSVPFTVPNGYQASGYTVWHAGDDGSLEKLTFRFSEGRLYWNADCFGDFVVTYVGELPHEHSYTGVVTKPTCTEKGYTTYTCECGEGFVADYTDPTGHSFTGYESNHDATCKEDGTETAKCDHGCGETDTRTDMGSKLDHKYEDGKCIFCGESQWIPETGDTGNIFLWYGLLILSLTAMLFLVFRKRRNKMKYQE